MVLFRDLDLYKIIILLGLVLLPASLGFVWWVDKELETAKVAVNDAIRPGGELEQIGTVAQQLEIIQRNARNSGNNEAPALFFERWIKNSASGGQVRATDFEISNERKTTVTKLKAQDKEIQITFRRENQELPLSREYIHALILNLEQDGPQVWKLRELQIRNEQSVEFSKNRREAPPKTVDDMWRIEKLMFARREPEDRDR